MAAPFTRFPRPTTSKKRALEDHWISIAYYETENVVDWLRYLHPSNTAEFYLLCQALLGLVGDVKDLAFPSHWEVLAQNDPPGVLVDFLIQPGLFSAGTEFELEVPLDVSTSQSTNKYSTHHDVMWHPRTPQCGVSAICFWVYSSFASLLGSRISLTGMMQNGKAQSAAFGHSHSSRRVSTPSYGLTVTSFI